MKVNFVDHFGYVVSVDRYAMTEKPKPERPKRAPKGDAEPPESASGLTPERLELIKRRIEEKFYDQEEVLREAAERMLGSKELEEFLRRLKDRNRS